MTDLNDLACACLAAADSTGGVSRYRYGWAPRPGAPAHSPGTIDAMTRRGFLTITRVSLKQMRAHTTPAGRDALKARQAESNATWAAIARRQLGERDDLEMFQ